MVQESALTRQLAEFVCHTREIPDEVLSAAKVALQDTIGVALAGSVEPAALAALDYVRETAASPQATIWGHSVRSAPGDAALVNAISAHALDFDDTLSTLRGHPSAPTLPVAFAIAEQVRATGKDLLVAYALGIEIAGKLGQVLGNGHYLKGWHNTGTIGVFSATAVAARLQGDSPEILQRAWGIAAAQSGGLLRNFGTMSKPFQAGHAAEGAVLAEALARRGFTSDQSIFDGKDSFLVTYGADGADSGSIIGKLGNPWDLIKPGINYKRWPCCYCSHRALGGLLDLLQKHRIGTDDIEQVSIGFPPGADEPLVYDDPRTGLEGKFSIQYPIATILLDGKLTAASFTDDALQRPAVRVLMKKVRRYRVEDSKVYSGTVGYTDVEIATGSAKFSARIDKGPGSSAWPMSVQEHDTKFMDSATRILDTSAAVELLGAIKRVDTLQDARTLIKMLARG